MALDSYAAIKSAHADLPAFKPLVPTGALPSIALVSLTAAFALTFILTTLHKKLPAELTIALLTAFLAGGGTVALFCTVGVHV